MQSVFLNECQNLFSGKNKRKIVNLSYAQFAQRVVEGRVKIYHLKRVDSSTTTLWTSLISNSRVCG